MFEILKNDFVIEKTEKPNYITIDKFGNYIPTCKARARGVMVDSIPYNLEWAEPMENLEKVCLRYANK